MPAPTDRAWYGLVALASAVFAAYVTLVPFQFAPPNPGSSILAFLWERAEIGVVSRGNGLANIVLFVPIGFFGLGALLDHRPGLARWPLAVTLVALASVVLSVGIEALQAFVPGRTPSLTDVVAQAIGTTAGMALWPMLAGRMRAWSAQIRAARSPAIGSGLVIYVAVLGLYLLMPLDVTVDLGALAEKYRTGMIVLNPFQSPSLGWEFVPGMIADFVMAAPAGALAVVGWRAGGRNTPLAACLLVIILFGCGEAAQVFVRSRTADPVDFAINVMGASVGVLLATQFVRDRGGYGEAARRPILVGALLVMTGLYVVYNWSPFDFTWSRAMLQARVSRLWSLPFASYYQNAEFKALSDATVKLCMSAPLGILLQSLLGPPARSRTTVLLFAVGAAIGFFLIEAGQVLLPSRFPDNTDVLLATGGVLVAMRLTRHFQTPPPMTVPQVRRVVPGLGSESVLVGRTPSGGEIRRRRRRLRERRPD